MITATAKPIELEPLAGFFDHRSPADSVPFGVWRYLQNMEMTARRKLRRAPGWEKLLSQVGYNNQDLHDHLTSLSTVSSRQPITFLQQAVTPAGFSKLIAGTSKRLFVLNNETGNWRVISDILGDGLGTLCSDQGWRAAQVGYTVIFTNGLDAPVYHILDQPPIEGNNQSVTQIPDLEKIGLTMAKTVFSYKGIVIFGNVIMDGERFSHRLVWSDVDKPLSWVPRAGESAANFQDLGYGEDILEMSTMGDSLIIYTTSGIWEGVITGGEGVFVFRKRYSDHTAGNRCLAYRRTLISTGSDHYYLGRDGIYRYNFYTDRPLREEWMHIASSVIFNDLSEGDCHVHCAGYNAKEKSIYISWAQRGENCASQTLVLNTEYESDYVLDHGFSAYVNYNPDDVLTLRTWLLEHCICSGEEITDEGFFFVKEGGYCVAPETPACAPVDYIYTPHLRTVDDLQVEDWEQPSAHPNSICAVAGAMSISQLCSGELEADECNAEQLFVAASTQDFALKQIGFVFSRERSVSSSGCGSYVYDGYTSIMRSGPLDMKSQSVDKLLRHLLVDVEADAAAEPSDLELRIGASYQPADPNTDQCSLRWFEQTPRALECRSITGAAHVLARTRQAKATEWATFIQDRYFVVEFSIQGTGGACSFSKLVFWVETKKM
jgi:hypothetical protein